MVGVALVGQTWVYSLTLKGALTTLSLSSPLQSGDPCSFLLGWW